MPPLPRVPRLARLLRGDEPRKAGWGATLLIAPHLVLGTWLLTVPDPLAFRTSEVVTLLHVGLAVLSAPLVAIWVVRHRQRMAVRPERSTRRAKVESWLLVATLLLAMASGVLVVWGGSIVRGHGLHAACSLLVGAALAAHLASGQRRIAALGVVSLLVTATGGAWIARALLPSESADPPKFAFEATSFDLYQPASYCGECHQEEYAEWSRSTHGTTLKARLVRDDMESHVSELGFNVADFGKIANGEPVPNAGAAIKSCERCHVPTDFYGEHREDARHPTGVAAEGITCSFCHSVRAVREGLARGQPIALDVSSPGVPAIHSREDWQHILPRLPYYVSTPEAVRRYFGEGSDSRAARWVANALIRWRPAVHSADLNAPILHTSKACMPCHSTGDFDAMHEGTAKTYVGWEHGGYATSDPETDTTCQDCHMATEITGLRSHERGKFVPWGPVRERHVSHLGIGGNTTVANVMHDDDLEAKQHELNKRVMDVAIVDSRIAGDTLEVDVRVESKLVGHLLPSVATQERWFWVEVRALDRTGGALGATKEPKSGDEAGGDTPIIFTCLPQPRPDCETALVPHAPRVMTAKLKLPPGAQPASVTAILHLSIDRQPLRETSSPFPRPG